MAELRKYSSLDNDEIDTILDQIDEHEQNSDPDALALYQSLVYGNDQLLIKSRDSVDMTDDEEVDELELNLSSAAKLLLVNGYIRNNFCNISKDIALTIYYFFDTELQRSHLSPYYYRCFYICRPFGLAICQRLNAQYICMVLPDSPRGRLGLRAGSKVLAYNDYIFDENDIPTLHQQFQETKSRNFTINKGIIANLANCLPVTLYLKYDPIELLEKMDESIVNTNDNKIHGNCNFFGLLHEETLRWAIDGKVEYFKINHAAGCGVYSSLPIQSGMIL